MSESTVGDKPPQSGLVDMGDIDFYNDPSDPTPQFCINDLTAYPGSFSEIVLNVTWAQLQATQSGTIDTSAIQQAITEVANYNTLYHTDLGIKLRVWGGYTAPEWAQSIDGPPVSVSGLGTIDPNKSQTETIGRFWSADYNNAWTSFQTQLASIYDGNPIIRGISNTQGAAATDEPFVPLHPGQVSELGASGYTDAAEEQTLRGGIADYSSWSTTPLDYTMNLFHLEDSGLVVSDANFTLAVLQLATNSSRTVQAGNHALNSPWPMADSFIYAQMQADAELNAGTVPGSYQTASPKNLGTTSNSGTLGTLGTWGSAISQGALADAGDIELWDGPGTTGFVGQSPTVVADLASILAAGVAPTTAAPDDGAALGFIAPGSVIGVAGTATFSGVDAVLLASASVAAIYTVTVTSIGGQTLIADLPGNTVETGSTLIFTGSLDAVNTDLARLTEALPSGTDILQFAASDSSNDIASRTVGVIASGGSEVVTATPAPITPAGTTAGFGPFTWTGDGQDALFSDADNWMPTNGPPGTLDTAIFSATPGLVTVAGTGAVADMVVDAVVVPGGGTTLTIGQGGTGDLDIADQSGSSGALILGGVDTSLTVAGNLDIGGSASDPGGSGLLLAALAPGDASTANLTVGGTVQVWGQGVARLTGLLSAGGIAIDGGGTIAGNGTLSVGGTGTITNGGVIEAVADQTVGLESLTLNGAIGGTGQLVVDPAATLTLQGSVASTQTIDFLPNSIAQFANDPYSPSALVLDDPLDMQGTIVGFTFADQLTLIGVDGTAATYNGNTLSIAELNGGTLNLPVYGNLNHTTPIVTEVGVTAAAITTVNFMAAGAGQPPSVSAPGTLHGAVGVPVLVPDIVLQTPLPAQPSDNTTILVTLVTAAGTLAAGNDNGNTTVSQLGPQTLILSGTLGAVERSLQTLVYQGSTLAKDGIQVTVSDYHSQSDAIKIAVTNSATGAVFDWAAPDGGSFGNAADWIAGTLAAETPPGGADVADFGAGDYTVSGDGAVGAIAVNGTVTLTGQVSAVAVNSTDTLTVDSGGALTLAGGAVLTAAEPMAVGVTGSGLLTLMGGALALTGTSSSVDSLTIGQSKGSDGTVLDLEQITAPGTIVVGEAGNGALRLLGAGSTASDGAGDIGQSGGGHGDVVVDGGFWVNAGQLTVGDGGGGSLLIGGAADGITGQVTAFDAIIAAQTHSTGIVTLAGGDLLIANATATASTLAVGGAGAGTLAVDGGGNVTVGAAAADTGTLSVGATSDGSGLVSIGDGSVMVDGGATVGAAGIVDVGLTAADTALLGMTGTLAVGTSGQVELGGPHATVRAATVTIASGGVISGAGTISGVGGGNNTTLLGAIDNDGTIDADGGGLLVYGGVAGAGLLDVESGATLTLQAAIAAGQTLAYSPDAQTVLDDVLAFTGTITNFGSGDVADLPSTDFSSATWNAEQLTLVGNSGTILLNVAGSYASDGFIVQPDGLGGTRVELACFAAGTRILTPGGLMAIETLSVGDCVVTQGGATRAIQWIGERRVDCRRHPQPQSVWPIRIKANAFGHRRPARDLYLSPDHAIYADGVLIPVRYLANRTTLRQMRVSSVVYYHLELATHDIVLAEGVAAETFLDTGNPGAFVNAQSAVQLHPDFGRSQSSLAWDARGFAPLCVTGPKVERLRAYLAARCTGPRVRDAATY